MEEPMPSLELHFFGPPQVTLDGVRIELTTRKALALLAYIILNRPTHSRDTLASLFWPEGKIDLKLTISLQVHL